MTSGSITWLVDRRGDLPPVGWQGDRPTCLSWATSTAHDHNRHTWHSIEFLHHSCRAYPAGIGSISAVTAALALDGQPPEAQWTYDPLADEAVSPPAPPSTVKGPFETATLQAYPTTATDLEGALGHGYVPVIGLRVSQDFRDAVGGVVLDSGPGSDGHAVVAVAVARYEGPATPVLNAGDRLVVVRNSWGARWGVEGHALIGPRAWATLVMAALLLDPS